MFPAKRIPPECPFWDRHVTFARLQAGDLRFCTDIADKEEALRTFRAESARGAIFFVAWTGQYKTHLFLVSQEDADRAIAERQATLAAQAKRKADLEATRAAAREAKKKK